MADFKTFYFWKTDLFEGQKGEIEIIVWASYDSDKDEHDVHDTIFDCAFPSDQELLPSKYIDCVTLGSNLMSKAGHRVH